MTKLSTDPYKGVRDFYPENQAVQNYIFSVWQKVAESYGYEEYSASILEPAELYRSKTSEEIVNQQTYTFTDRGDREVTLRPEMTPTVARMVAARKRELGFPLRWYSIPNLFRYERPQRGRLREHWQLNVDIFGNETLAAEVEIISLAYGIMRAFGAKDEDFEIKVNNRGALKNALMSEGMSDAEAETELSKMDKGKSDHSISPEATGVTKELLALLSQRGISNVRFDPALVRGFSYYTGTVFEIFDIKPENSRSIFGGGRYDNLLELFGGDKIPAVGFGLGDVTMRDFLETHNLLPALRSTTDVMICFEGESLRGAAAELAGTLRKEGVNVAVYEGKKQVGEQRQIAEKKRIPFTLTVSEDGTATLKELATGTETTESTPAIAQKIKENR